jgi:hypothetical protein
VKTASLSLTLPVGVAALSKSLSDPEVVRVARSLKLNLRDPAILGRLLKEMNRYLSLSAQVRSGHEQRTLEGPDQGQSQYVRNALRIYREIDAMK